MKKRSFAIVIQLSLLSVVYAQNTGIGTNSPKGRLHIKGNADTSQLVIDANSAQSNIHPLIRLRDASGLDLLHIHADNPANTFVGLNAGKANNVVGGALANTFIGALAGSSNSTGYSLTGIGRSALFSNTSGAENTAIGSITLYYNTVGSNNTAIGRGALYQTDAYDNTATGFKSLFSNTSANRNTATGSQSLVANILGSDNTAMGYKSLGSNNGSQNTAIGGEALYSNTTGQGNVAVGYQANASANTSYNTMVGQFAYASGNRSVAIGADTYVNGSNSTVIGSNAIIFGDNKMQLGNTLTAVIATAGGYTVTSDGRFKDNVSDLTPGLDFIVHLRPVSYNFNYKRLDDFLNRARSKKNTEAAYEKQLADKTSHREIGFIAQEVEKLCVSGNYTFNAVYKPQNDNDQYSLDYSKFVVPLVKAMQEQQNIIDDLKLQMVQLKKELDLLKSKN